MLKHLKRRTKLGKIIFFYDFLFMPSSLNLLFCSDFFFGALKNHCVMCFFWGGEISTEVLSKFGGKRMMSLDLKETTSVILYFRQVDDKSEMGFQ